MASLDQCLLAMDQGSKCGGYRELERMFQESMSTLKSKLLEFVDTVKVNELAITSNNS